MVLVEGRLRPDPKTGGPAIYQRQDGTAGASFEIVANTIRFLSPRDDSEAPAEGVEMADTTPPSEDIPF